MAAARRLSLEQIVSKLREAGVLPTAYLVLLSGGAAFLAQHVTAILSLASHDEKRHTSTHRFISE